MTSARSRFSFSLLTALAAASPAWAQGDKPVYRCPGNPPLYTDALSAKEARDKGCRTLEGAPITVIQSPKPRPTAGAPVPPAASREKVDSAEQRNRDSDARRILEAELKREEEQLASLRKDFNNGEPERRGDERNYQKYLDRVAEMKAAIARKENDVAALRRELGKQPPPSDASPKLQ
ncbi:hypothetical protein [Piscinibacter sp. HJYY11]|uniref:hypothetical protein n=1 Tax=Piscinibacter sp. HJYY11 TaxID=2801333 RepID=UPI00191E151C|nr:hypothetical protein [Piscinibacter sp. HJYY11]MBL0730865.1 hypothetical protein [Piscinibacter sp. HJYY11]